MEYHSIQVSEKVPQCHQRFGREEVDEHRSLWVNVSALSIFSFVYDRDSSGGKSDDGKRSSAIVFSA